MAKYTPQQYYMIALPKAKILRQKKLEGTITPAEERALDVILEKLWALIYRYAVKEGWTMSNKYRRSNDFFEDLKQDLHLKWLEVLWDYDPIKTKPTTYFKFYFVETTRNAVVSNSQKMPQSIATNISKVRRAKAYFDAKGIVYDDLMLAEASGLSIKVTKETLFFETNAIQGDIDDMLNEVPDEYTPEKFVAHEDELKTLLEICKSELSDEEFKVLMAYIDVDESYYDIEDIFDDDTAMKKHNAKYKNHYKTQTALAKEFDTTPTRISNLINSARNKIRENSTFIEMYGSKATNAPKMELNTKLDKDVIDIKNQLMKDIKINDKQSDNGIQ